MVKEPKTQGADRAGKAENGPGNRRNFDNLFKELTWKSDALPTALGALSIDSHLATEFSETSRRADYCVRLIDGSILHVEFQSADEPGLVWRMVNYRRLIRTKIDPACRVRQVVLYVGADPPPGAGIRLADDQLEYCCDARDIKDFDPHHFLDSPEFDDNVLALLCHGGSTPGVLHRLKVKFDTLPDDRLEDARRKLLLAGGLRNMSRNVLKEFTMSKALLRKDPFFGELLDEERAQGKAEGRAEGEAVGRAEGWRAGVIETRVADLGGIFEARGWTVPGHVLDAARVADIDTLWKMVTTAAIARSVEEFEERFGISDRPGS